MSEQDNKIDGQYVYQFFCGIMELNLDELSKLNKIDTIPSKQVWDEFKNNINNVYEIDSIKNWLGTSCLWIILVIILLIIYKILQKIKDIPQEYIFLIVLLSIGILLCYTFVVFGIIGYILILKELIPKLESTIGINSVGPIDGYGKLYEFFNVDNHGNILIFFIGFLVVNFACILTFTYISDIYDISTFQTLVMFIFVITFFGLFGKSIEIVRKLNNLQ